MKSDTPSARSSRRSAGLHSIANLVLAAFILAAISTLGYGGIVLCMTIESACIPLPSEIIMPFSGYLVTTGRFTLCRKRRQRSTKARAARFSVSSTRKKNAKSSTLVVPRTR